jgi:hypothetical protein
VAYEVDYDVDAARSARALVQIYFNGPGNVDLAKEPALKYNLSQF